MPYGTDLALSTLRTLARRQGTKVDPDSEEQPGKILHEVRNTTLELGGMSLPPVYYGTVDATPLFVCTLADAWQWGADRDAGGRAAARRAPLPGLGDGAVARSPAGCATSTCPGRGLANQGWKDSVDSVQFADGRLADPPIALSEVQGYAYEAAVRGAALLEAFGEEPVDGLADWAAVAQGAVRPRLLGGHPRGRPRRDRAGRRGRTRSTRSTSNMGHLLGTGILGARSGPPGSSRCSPRPTWPPASGCAP